VLSNIDSVTMCNSDIVNSYTKAFLGQMTDGGSKLRSDYEIFKCFAQKTRKHSKKALNVVFSTACMIHNIDSFITFDMRL
jgi:hypothetical protein